MTEDQRQPLARMSDDQPHMGKDLTESGLVLRNLLAADYIRIVRNCGPLLVCDYEITPKGHRALRASE